MKPLGDPEKSLPILRDGILRLNLLALALFSGLDKDPKFAAIFIGLSLGYPMILQIINKKIDQSADPNFPLSNEYNQWLHNLEYDSIYVANLVLFSAVIAQTLVHFVK
ncbi:MAG: hypothetical protein UX92_C0003G0007 [Candidatus Amesbacteria bacterium GW2011_GWA1_47_20]|uniref:Uncharacterized protein n=1 Tax=Candidatus Amesbacteria bacterium GW2011_GWA1_47_20 TaxID=1618354 RepID=A0A0G1SL72_9BACT|nr:MAG: hypothetical protein UX42_C0014G0008 [Microgenomates group bacterium GW2011_GWC1_46_20]KKU70187.1 MAG: hypothetical protein UX92_C0003G0007 [Candidatus Amesbacteria bacterium GW2011_GWA1_47_20]